MRSFYWHRICVSVDSLMPFVETGKQGKSILTLAERKKQMEEHIAEKKRLRAEEEARGEL